MMASAAAPRRGREPAAIMLDFDGLICDTERAAFLSWCEFYRDFGYGFPPDLWGRMRGRSTGELTGLADLAGRVARPVSAVEQAWRRRRKQQLADDEPLRPGVRRLIDAAGRLDVAVAVVSSSPTAWVHHHLSRLGIADRLAEVVTGDDSPAHKPAPHLYLLALRRLGVSPRRAVAFEDSAAGVTAATAAGLLCVACPSTVGCRAEVAAADLVVDDLTGIDLDEVLPVCREVAR